MTLPIATARTTGELPDAITPVRAGRTAIAAGLVAAGFAFAMLAVTELPERVVAMLGGATGFARTGGLRMTWSPPPGADLTALARHAGVRRDGDMLILEVPDVPAADVAATAAWIGGSGGVEFRETFEGNELVALDKLAAGVAIEIDQWRPEDGGPLHNVPYAIAPTREALEAAVGAATRAGWQPPEGTQVAYQVVEGFDQTPGFWRTYLVGSAALLDGDAIANAVVSFDPNTNRPIVLLDFNREGSERFAVITERLVGRKLATVVGAEVVSAPIINGVIRGGRASITMGGTDPVKQQQEATMLVRNLRAGALPRGGKVVSATYRAPDDTGKAWLARGVLALAGGLVVALVASLLVRVARPVWRARPRAFDGRLPLGRVAVTLLAPIAIYAASKLSAFGTERSVMGIPQGLQGMFGEESTGVALPIGALGIAPVMTAYVIVELFALGIPAWRRRRHAGPVARAPFGIAIALLAVTLAVIQAWFLGASIDSMTMVEGSLVDRLALIGSLVGATAILVWLATVIREHGLGDGYGALLAGGVLVTLGRQLPMSSLSSLVMTWAPLVAIAVLVIAVLRWRVYRAGEVPLRVPTSGGAPLGDAGGLVILATTLALLPSNRLSDAVFTGSVALHTHWWLVLGLVVVLGIAWSAVFARPGAARGLATKLGVATPTFATWGRATLVSVAVLVAVQAIALAATTSTSVGVVAPFEACILAAVLLDVHDDFVARRAQLAPVWTLHHAQHADLVARALDDAGIPHHLQATNVRTLLAFFGPFAPIGVLVPLEHVPEARTKLAALFG